MDRKSILAHPALAAPLLLIGALAIGGCHSSGSLPFSELDRHIERVARSRRTNPVALRRASSDRTDKPATQTRSPGQANLVSLRIADPVANSGQPSLQTVSRFKHLQDDPTGDQNASGTRAQESTSLPLVSFRATVKRDLKTFPSDLWSDTKAVYSSPTNLVILGLAYGGSLTLQGTDVDKSIADSLKGDDIFSHDVNMSFGAAGNPLTHLGIAGLWYLAGQRSQDAKTYDVGKTLMRALIINDLSVIGGKLATSKTSPNGESFSFPSGHTSSTFTLASVMHHAYGPWAGYPLYGLGVFVAAERMDDNEHYLSDVVMGSVMGLIIGHTVAGEDKLELFGGEITPYTDPEFGATGLAWHKRLRPF